MIAWMHHQLQALRRALALLLAHPAGTLLSISVVGIALSLPASGYVLLDQFSKLGQNLSGTPEMSLFLDDGLDDATVTGLRIRLEAHPGLAQVRFVSREQALERMAEAGLGDLTASLPSNPLPDAFVLLPRDLSPQSYAALSEEFSRWPEVVHLQSDAEWVRQLHALLAVGQVLLLLLAVLLGITLIIVTFNTIRLQLLTRQEEIKVSQLLGASAPFVRRPYYWFGILQGVLGGLVAILAVHAVVAVLAGPVARAAEAYAVSVALGGPTAGHALVITLFAAALGWCGSALAVGRHVSPR